MFLQSVFQFGFLSSKPCLFPLESSLDFVIHRGKPKVISLPVKFAANRSRNGCVTSLKTVAMETNCSLNFIRLLRVVDSKQLDEFQARLTVLPCLLLFFF